MRSIVLGTTRVATRAMRALGRQGCQNRPKQLRTMAASSAGRKRRPWSTTIIVPHVACLRGSWGTLSAEGSIGELFRGAIAAQLGTLTCAAAAVAIVYGDRDGRQGRQSRRPLRRTSRCLAARILCREIAPRYRTLSTEGAPGPPEASDMRADDGGGPWPPLPPGGRGGHCRKILDGL